MVRWPHTAQKETPVNTGVSSGGGGIRTPDALADMTVFKTADSETITRGHADSSTSEVEPVTVPARSVPHRLGKEWGGGSTVLTPAQMRVLREIRTQTETFGVCPSYREIGRALGIAPPPVCQHVRKLASLGLIIHDPSRPRSLELVESPSKRLAKLVKQRFPADAELAKLADTVLRTKGAA